MFSESSWVPEPPALAAIVLRRLIGILEVPGMVIFEQLKLHSSLMEDVTFERCWHGDVATDLHFTSELGLWLVKASGECRNSTLGLLRPTESDGYDSWPDWDGFGSGSTKRSKKKVMEHKTHNKIFHRTTLSKL